MNGITTASNLQIVTVLKSISQNDDSLTGDLSSHVYLRIWRTNLTFYKCPKGVLTKRLVDVENATINNNVKTAKIQ